MRLRCGRDWPDYRAGWGEYKEKGSSVRVQCTKYLRDQFFGWPMLEARIIIVILVTLLVAVCFVELFFPGLDVARLWKRLRSQFLESPFEGGQVAKARQPGPSDKECRACTRVGPVDPAYGYCNACLHVAHSIVLKG